MQQSDFFLYIITVQEKKFRYLQRIALVGVCNLHLPPVAISSRRHLGLLIALLETFPIREVTQQKCFYYHRWYNVLEEPCLASPRYMIFNLHLVLIYSAAEVAPTGYGLIWYYFLRPIYGCPKQKGRRRYVLATANKSLFESFYPQHAVQ